MHSDGSNYIFSITARTWESLTQTSSFVMRPCVSIAHVPGDKCINQLWKSLSTAHACTVRNEDAHNPRTHTRAPVVLTSVVPLKIRIQGQWFIKLLLSRKCHAKGTLLYTDANSGLSHGAIEKLCTWCFSWLQPVSFQSSPRLFTAVLILSAKRCKMVSVLLFNLSTCSFTCLCWTCFQLFACLFNTF